MSVYRRYGAEHFFGDAFGNGNNIFYVCNAFGYILDFVRLACFVEFDFGIVCVARFGVNFEFAVYVVGERRVADRNVLPDDGHAVSGSRYFINL